MGLFNKNKSKEVDGKKAFNVYSLITSLAIVVLFVAVGLIVLGFRGVFHFNSGILLTIITMFIVSGAALLALPWVRRLQKKQNIIVCWVFVGLLVLCAIFWLICAFLIVAKFKVLNEIEAKDVVGTINFVKFTLIYTMQYAIASLIANNIIKFRTRMIPFQVILYLSNLFVDVYVTIILCCINFNADTFISINTAPLYWLINPIVSTLFMLAFIYMIIANAIAKRIERRRIQYARDEDEMPDEMFGGRSKPKNQTKSAQEKLTELKTMLDQNLITQEEFDKKKEEILKEM